jgi:hypothetical protein
LVPFKKKLELNLKADLVFNSSSFSEMSRDTINYYFDWINNKIKPKYIFHQNSNVLLFPNSKRHIEILASQLSHGVFHNACRHVAEASDAAGQSIHEIFDGTPRWQSGKKPSYKFGFSPD